MSAELDADRARRAARWVAPVGLGGGAILLVATAVYLEASPDGPAAAWVEARLPSGARHLAMAAGAVLGTMLMSVGAVFALLDWVGVLVAGTVQRTGVEALEPRRDLSAPAWQDSGSASPHGLPAEPPAPSPDLEVRSMRPANAAAFPAASGTGGDGAPGAEPVPSVDPPGGRDVEDGAGDAGRAHAGAPLPELLAPVHETGETSLAVDEPTREPPQPGDLIDAWDEYRRSGDGHFNPRGLQQVLHDWRLAAVVGHGDRVGAGGAILVVETPGSPNFCVLPSFNKSPRAVAEWFDDHSGGALTGRTQRVARVARGRWLETRAGAGSFEVIERGEVA